MVSNFLVNLYPLVDTLPTGKKWKADWENSLMETYSSSLISLILNRNLLYHRDVFFTLKCAVTLHVM